MSNNDIFVLRHITLAGEDFIFYYTEDTISDLRQILFKFVTNPNIGFSLYDSRRVTKRLAKTHPQFFPWLKKPKK